MTLSSKLSEPAAVLALLVLALGCAALLFSLPRAVVPRELPNITLPKTDVDAVLRADARDAKSAPDDAHSRELDALFLAQGEAEARGVEDLDSYSNRRKALELGFAALSRELGAVRALGLRARATERLETALAVKLRKADAKAVLGVLPSVLEREGATRDGEIVAPRFVVRTLYKARWNILHGLAPDFSFARVERRAFYGWKALHAQRIAPAQRIEALHAYGDAGGTDLEEALGVLLYQLGDYEQAQKALEAAYRKTGSLRLRNYVLAARAAALPRD